MRTVLSFLPWIILAVILVTIVLAACIRNPSADAAETVTFDAAAQRQIAEESLDYLQQNITDSMTFGQITDLFEQLCADPTTDELIVFEAGTYPFVGTDAFTVSLARQIPNGIDDEFFLIRAEVSFAPNAENQAIEDLMWLDLAHGDDFSAVRRSDAFLYADSHISNHIELRIDET